MIFEFKIFIYIRAFVSLCIVLNIIYDIVRNGLPPANNTPSHYIWCECVLSCQWNLHVPSNVPILHQSSTGLYITSILKYVAFEL